MGNQASTEDEAAGIVARSSPDPEPEVPSPSTSPPEASSSSDPVATKVDDETTTSPATAGEGPSDADATEEESPIAAGSTPSPSPPSPVAEPKKVLIVGAGPAGLLAAIFLLRRNASNEQAKYQVTVVDPGVDYGALDSEGLKRYRSWMIGLSCHGLKAIKRVPDLYDEYIAPIGLTLKHAVTAFGKYKRKVKVEDLDLFQDTFIVDRNYIVAGLARYLNEKFGDSVNFVSKYGTKAVFVDGENRRVLVRDNAGMNGSNGNNEESESYLDYDLLLGCDGIRSVVRNAFVTAHRDFEFDLKGLFGTGKSIHIPLPEDVEDGTFMFLVNVVPNGTSFVLPETGQMLNVGMGFKKNKPPPPELYSTDVKVVSAYFREHFTAFKIDPDLFAKEWINQTWNSISMVHCNYYHSEQLGALLMGDAAHATSPQIGQGMNTALADAEALNDLLDKFGDNNFSSAILAEFSKERVKEGQALTDLSFYSFSLSPLQQLGLMARQQIHDALHRFLPSFFNQFPMTAIGARGMKLSEAYNRMSQMGIIQRVRRNNDDIMREYFERKVGMVAKDEPSRGISTSALGVCSVMAVIAGVSYAYCTGGEGGWDFSTSLQ